MYYTMENFINYCDKMQIAEEGVLNIEKITNTNMDDLKNKLIKSAKKK